MVHPQTRPARAADLRRLRAIEDSGTALFEEVFGDLSGDALASPGTEGRDRIDLPGFLLVAGEVGEPVGFAHVVYAEGLAHLAQLSVLPVRARQGLGSALVHRVLVEAWQDGFDAVSLTTYRDVAWNGPFYARLGFVEVGEDEPFLRRQRDHERTLGLDRHGPRVVMRARTGRPTRRHVSGG